MKKKRKELTWQEQKRILHQAEAIKLLDLMKAHGLSPEQCLKIEGRNDLIIQLKRFDDNRNWIDHEWLLPLWNSTFWPLLEQGFKNYLAAIERVAETGDISWIKWDIPEEPKGEPDV